jgi:alkylation response protein AidB-like acyl-CoA dehydrogenase
MATGPLARAQALGSDIAAAADEIEKTRRIPADLLEKLHDARLCRMLLPRSFDGDEVEPGTYLLSLESVARHDASVGWNLFTANSAALLAAHLEPETAKTIYGPRNAVVAWGPPNATVATVEPGGYRVSGRWSFASGCRQATWMGLHCRVAEPGGEPRLNRFGKPEIRSMLFPVEKATLVDTWDTIGLRGTASDSYSVEDLFVADAFTGSREYPEDRREPGRLYAFTTQGLYAVGVAGVALGIAGAMLDSFKKLASDKTPRNLSLLADSPAIQSGVARAEARLGAARAYALETLGEIYARAGSEGAIDFDDRARVRLAASNAIQGAIEVADWTYKRAGVDAIFRGTPYERRFRDMHTLSQQTQSRDAQFEAVGQILLGRPPAVFQG